MSCYSSWVSGRQRQLPLSFGYKYTMVAINLFVKNALKETCRELYDIQRRKPAGYGVIIHNRHSHITHDMGKKFALIRLDARVCIVFRCLL